MEENVQRHSAENSSSDPGTKAAEPGAEQHGSSEHRDVDRAEDVRNQERARAPRD
jgi:hypothetical protein